MNSPGADTNVPLCVSCDHALLKTNILQEVIFLFIKRRFRNVFLLSIWFLRGRSQLIRQISSVIEINWRTVPVSEGVVQRMRAADADNRQVFLLTSMPTAWAHELCAALDCARAIVLDDSTAETSAGDTRSALSVFSSARGFDYIGDGRRDLPICNSARRVIIVTSDRDTIEHARRHLSVEGVISEDSAGLFAFLQMIRVHQWVKNFLIWVPLLAAHKFTSLHSIGIAAMAFMSFSFCASSVYVLNDLLDVESDRQHLRKRYRPIAAGRISVNQALIIGLMLFALSAWLAFSVSTLFALTVGVYFVMTSAYSLRLKRQVIVDVMLLAALYTIRVVAGAVATTVVPSFWLLAFSVFLFLSLAVVKRYSEMLVTLSQEKRYASGRGYSVEDLPVLLSLGISAGVAATVVLALYINDPSTNKLYPSTIWLWPVPPLILYWVSRVWMKAHRGELHDDPVVFAMHDWQSLVTVVLGGLCFAVAAI
jgi:4-hydroxybenzoate polyprenyltransferase